MQDLLEESVQLQRIDLVARLINDADCKRCDKELAVAWIAEMTTCLLTSLDEHDRDVGRANHA